MIRHAGFTLVEIAIVLVVIGLLLGGVLKGQELVLNSKIRNAINEYNNVASAMYAYQDRYRQIPGDDNTAAGRWAGVPVGNRNGIIEGANNFVAGTPANANDEVGLFWQHLRNDDLINGAKDAANGAQELPRNSFDGYTGVDDTVFFVAPNGIIGPAICQSNIQFKPAGIIDTRIDDGVGDEGSLLAGVEVAGTGANLANAAQAYANGSRHTLCRQL